MANKIVEEKESWRVFSGDVCQDESEVLRLWDIGFPGKLSDHKYTWFYKFNGKNEALIYFLNYNQENIGVLGIGGRKIDCGSEDIKGGVLVDFTVSPAYRSIGPALKLIKGSTKQALANLDLLYGFPNPNSFLIYKRAGFTVLGNVKRYSKVVRYSKQLAKYSSTLTLFGYIVDKMALLRDWFANRYFHSLFQAGIQTNMPEGVDALWGKKRSCKSYCMVERDEIFLKWRFEKCYKYNYEFFSIRNKRDLSLEGYVCYRIDEDAIAVADFLASDDNDVLEALFQLFVQYMRKSKYRVISLEFLGDDRVVSTLQSVGFIPRGENPIVLSTSHKSESLNNPKNWYITSADRD